MKLDDIKVHLKIKQKTEKDLFRFIKNRTDENPNYTLLLGAGCSISSGVRSGAQLCKEWREEILMDLAPNETINLNDQEKKEYLKNNLSEWYDPQAEYSSLFEKKYDLQRQRRMFVETEIKNSSPSIGYSFLTNLVDQSFFNTIFTTNFDDLINEAFFSFANHRPIVCAHDSSINSITVTSKRPKIIKLHGDYLFDDIKATNRETESLDKNMKEKFIEFAKDYGLIVVGYAGYDRSIMETISSLLKNENYFRNGIYWCIRSDSEIPEELKRLLWNDRVFFVEIDGFDEFFANLFNFLNPDKYIPSSLENNNIGSNSSLASSLIKSIDKINTNNEILIKSKEELTKLTKKRELANLFINSDSEKIQKSQRRFDDDEVILLTKLRNLLSDKNHIEFCKSAEKEFKTNKNDNIKSALAEMLFDCYTETNESIKSKTILDEMHKDEPWNPHWLLKLADIEDDKNKKLSIIDQAIKINPYYSYSFSKKADLLQNIFFSQTPQERSSTFKEICDLYETSIVIEPNRNNPAWGALHTFILNECSDTEIKESLLNDLELKLEKQGKYWKYFSLKTNRVNNSTSSKEIDELKKYLEEAKNRTRPDASIHYDSLYLKALTKTNNKEESKNIYHNIFKNGKYIEDRDVCLILSKYLKKIEGNFSMAAHVLEQHLDSEEYDYACFESLLEIYSKLKLPEFIIPLIEKYKIEFNTEQKINSDILLHIANSDYHNAIMACKELINYQGHQNGTNYGYLLLKNNSYDEAKKFFKEHLEKWNYAPDQYTEVINYEFSKNKLGEPINEKRVLKSLEYTKDINFVLAKNALIENFSEIESNMKQMLDTDKSTVFDLLDWPILEKIRNNDKFKKSFYQYEENLKNQIENIRKSK